MTNVYAWPVVGITGSEWTTLQPVSVSRSLITGARFVSQFQRERRVASLVVSALGRGGMGAGYMEMLKRLLAGGVNLVRLTSYPINGYNAAGAALGSRDAQPLEWLVDNTLVDGVLDQPSLRWFSGRMLDGKASFVDGWNTVVVTGLPPSRLVARPGEFLSVFMNLDDKVGAAVQIMAPAWSDQIGQAVVRVFSPLAHDGRVNIGSSDTAVFEALTIPRAVQGIAADWTYSWEFREVFADEVPGGFVEVNPWI